VDITGKVNNNNALPGHSEKRGGVLWTSQERSTNIMPCHTGHSGSGGGVERTAAAAAPAVERQGVR
jgi:hypothetical protein